MSKIIIKNPGSLTKYGYHLYKPLSSRRRAIKKAIKEYGALSVFRKINALYVFNKNYNLIYAKNANVDKKYIRDNFMKKRTKRKDIMNILRTARKYYNNK